MDVVFFLLNGMAVFFGLGSFAFTAILTVVTKNRRLPLYALIQLLLIIRHGLYIFKADIPVLALTAGVINYLYLSDFCLILLLIYSLSFFLNRVLGLNFPGQLLPLLIPFTALYLYAGISSLWPWLSPAIQSFSPLVWIFCGYGAMAYLAGLSLFCSDRLTGEDSRFLARFAGMAALLFSVLMAVDDLYLFPSLKAYGFFSFPLFLLVWNALSIVFLVRLFLKPRGDGGVKLDRLGEVCGLSGREMEIAHLLISGLSYKEIGEGFISPWGR